MKMLPHILKSLLTASMLLAAAFFLLAFVQMEPDIESWHWSARAIFGGLCFVLGAAVTEVTAERARTIRQLRARGLS